MTTAPQDVFASIAPTNDVEACKMDALLTEIHENITHPKIWNTKATQLMMDFNREYTDKGNWMEKQPACNHAIIVRVLHLQNFIAVKSLPGTVSMILQAIENCPPIGSPERAPFQRNIEVSITEFLTQSFFLLAILARNGIFFTF